MSDKNWTKPYWDSCTYLDYLSGDHPKQAEMQMILDDWKHGGPCLVTSALTIAEVLWVKCEDGGVARGVDKSREAEIVALFEPPKEQKFTLVEVSRVIAGAARELVWSHNVRPKDAIHLASALAAHCDVFHTNDRDLRKLSGKLGGSPPLTIEEPIWTLQTTLELDAGDPPRLLEPPRTDGPEDGSPSAS